jgi:hypothetical protein
MKKRILLFTILLCCAFNVVAQEHTEPEEYSIYKVLLESWFINTNTKHVVIRKFTSNEDSDKAIISSFIRRKLSQVKPDTLDDYFNRNRKSFELKDNFGISPIVSLITEEDLLPIRRKEKADLGEAYKKAFKEQYSTEYLIWFSRVGFNKSKNQALIQVSYSCGTTCGEGNYVILSKKKDRWIIKKKLLRWIS